VPGASAADLASSASASLPTQNQRLPEPIPDKQIEDKINPTDLPKSFWTKLLGEQVNRPPSDDELALSAVPIVGPAAVSMKRGYEALNDPNRYQMWPERMVRSGFTLAGDVMSGDEPFYTTDETTGEQVISPRIIERSMDMAGLGGVGGIGGTGEAAGTALGAGPFLRPALKYEGRIYKAPQGGQHLDALPSHMQDEFTA